LSWFSTFVRRSSPLIEKQGIRVACQFIHLAYGFVHTSPGESFPKSAAADRAEIRRRNGLIAGKPVSETEPRVIRNQWGRPIDPCRAEECVSHKGKPLLLIEPRPSIAGREKTALFRSLAWAKLDEIRFVRQLPVNKRHNAKIDYPALCRMLT
jgi:hypothetical protein